MCFRLIVIMSIAVSSIVVAQNAPTRADRLSGQWQAYGRTLLELKSEAKGTVSGTVHFHRGGERFSAPVKVGRFDAGQNSVRLEGTIQLGDGVDTPYTIEGALDGDMLRAKFAFGRDTGEVTLSRAAG
jgi:hypothetical protein